MLSNDKLLDLSGRVAIVTGGASGIGFGIASRLAEAKATVLIADMDGSRAIDSSNSLKEKGLSAFDYQIDISNEDSVRALMDFALSHFGGLDILVNNAGVYPAVSLTRMSASDFDRVLAVNLKGAFLCLKYAAEKMIEQGAGGKIINITSIDAIHPSMVGLAHYDASKHGLWGLTKNAALEYAPYKIQINAIAPGAIATQGVAAMQQEGTDQQSATKALLNKIPMKRMGEPDDIGKVALFLASDMSSYMTGEQIVVDGGMLLS